MLKAPLWLAGLLALSLQAQAGPSLTRYTDQTLDYWVLEPSGYDGTTAYPLVVYLHGCNQDGPDVAVGTRWDEVAQANDVLVVFPEQRSGFIAPFTTGNATGCWNFHSPEHMLRGSGEPKLIADVTSHVAGQWNVDADRVYIAGASAGGAMAAIMAATYPDLYAASGILAGCPYAGCSDFSGVLAHQAMGAQARMVPAMIVHGTLDEVTNYTLGEMLVQEWLGVADLVDDGLWNFSVARSWAALENYGWDPVSPFSGDHCVSFSGDRFPCPGGMIGFADTYPYTIRRYDDAAGSSIVEFWIIHFAGHGYVGGDPAGSFTDPLGPDVTSAMWDFFASHPR